MFFAACMQSIAEMTISEDGWLTLILWIAWEVLARVVAAAGLKSGPLPCFQDSGIWGHYLELLMELLAGTCVAGFDDFCPASETLSFFLLRGIWCILYY